MLSIAAIQQPIFTITNDSIDINALAWAPDETMIASGGNHSLMQVGSRVMGIF
jgi:hypothetical protein